MPVNIIQSSVKFCSDSSYPADYTTNLAGLIGERIRLDLEVEVGWYFITNLSNTVVVSDTGKCYTRTVGSWIKEGFTVGDKININGSYAGQILQLNDLVMITDITCISPDGTYGDGDDGGIVMCGITDLTAILYKFGLIENAETFNILSKISGNDQVYYASGIGTGYPRDTLTHVMQSLGVYKDWCSGTLHEISYDSHTSHDLIFYQKFKITHDFILNPFYLVEYINNFEDSTIPDILAGLNSLKYVFEMEFRTVLSNPNTSKTARVENNLGCTAWFNENFNGFNNNYEIDSISYKDTTLGTACDGLQRGQRTTATITINKTSGSFNAGDSFSVIVSACPEASAYQDTLTTMQENFVFDIAVNDEGAATVTGDYGIIKECTAAIVSAQLVVTAKFEYTSAQQLLIPLGSKYFIGVLVQDESLSLGNSDKVMLLADYTEYIASADIADLMFCTGYEILQHPKDPTVDTGVTKCDLWNEDGVCLKYDFWLDLSKDALLNSLKLQVLAYNTVTEEYFTLDEYAINLNNIIISGGVQQINITDSRGYLLPTTDYFGIVKITTGAKIGNKQYYQMFIGQKTPWQTWISNINADTVFYDSAEENNNLNNKSSNYSGLNDYQIKFALTANVAGTSPLGVSGNTDYLMISQDLTVYDYDLPTTWEGTIETFNSAGTVNLGGAILNNEDTLFRITWLKPGSVFRPGYNFWAIHRIEESKETGVSIYELSSIVTSVTNNILKPVTGLYLSLTSDYVAKEVITECLIDYTKLDSTKNYKISGRLDDGLGSGYTPVGKLTEDGTLKQTEDGQIKILD